MIKQFLKSPFDVLSSILRELKSMQEWIESKKENLFISAFPEEERVRVKKWPTHYFIRWLCL